MPPVSVGPLTTRRGSKPRKGLDSFSAIAENSLITEIRWKQIGEAAGMTTGMELVDPASEAQGNAKPAPSLRKLEHIVETNAMKGAVLWRKAADALLEIKDRKLWKIAKDVNGDGYRNFVEYAEDRFGFRKTYAYDLVKAATRKPEALTEGEARAEMKAERGVTPLTRDAAIEKIVKAFQRFQDASGDARDRAIDDEPFVRAFDKLARQMDDALRAFVGKYVTIEDDTATDNEAEPPVSPKRAQGTASEAPQTA